MVFFEKTNNFFRKVCDGKLLFGQPAKLSEPDELNEALVSREFYVDIQISEKISFSSGSFAWKQKRALQTSDDRLLFPTLLSSRGIRWISLNENSIAVRSGEMWSNIKWHNSNQNEFPNPKRAFNIVLS